MRKITATRATMIAALLSMALAHPCASHAVGTPPIATSAPKSSISAPAQKTAPSQLAAKPKPFAVMREVWTALGLSEEKIWALCRSSNTLLRDFRMDFDLAHTLALANDYDIDDQTRQANRNYVVKRINTLFTSLNMTVDDQRNTAWLIGTENDFKKQLLKMPLGGWQLPFDPDGLRKYLDGTGESGLMNAGGSAGPTGAGGVTPAGGTPPPQPRFAGNSMMQCLADYKKSEGRGGPVQGGGAKAGGDSAMGAGDDFGGGGAKKGGSRPSVTDGSNDSTTTENGSLEGRPGTGSACGAVKLPGGGDVSQSDDGKKPNSLTPKGNSWSVTKTQGGEDGKTTVVSFKADKVIDTSTGPLITKGTLTVTTSSPGSGNTTKTIMTVNATTTKPGVAPSDGGALTPDQNKDLHNQALDGAKDGKQPGDTVTDKQGSDVKNTNSNKLDPDGTGPSTPCGADAAAFGACTEGTVGLGPMAQMKQLALDCQASKATQGGSDSVEGWDPHPSNGATVQTKKTPSGNPNDPCGKMSPGCMNFLLKGPTTDYEQDFTPNCGSDAEALGYSLQAMITDPADFVSKLGATQLGQTMQGMAKFFNPMGPTNMKAGSMQQQTGGAAAQQSGGAAQQSKQAGQGGGLP